MDRQHRFNMTNQAHLLIWEITEDQLLGHTELEAFPRGTAERLWADNEEIMRTGRTLQIEEELHLADGTAVVVVVTKFPLRDKDGMIVGLGGVATDITARKRAEEALRVSESRFRTMANAAPVFIWIVGTDMSATWVNQVWLDFTGRTLDQELGSGWTEHIHPEDYAQCLDAFISHFDRREKFRMEYRVRRHDGEYRWIVDQGVPMVDGQGNFSGYIGSRTDITPIKDYQLTVRSFFPKVRQIVAKCVHLPWKRQST
jgi:PAS domain S-box-containing protein